MACFGCATASSRGRNASDGRLISSLEHLETRLTAVGRLDYPLRFGIAAHLGREAAACRVRSEHGNAATARAPRQPVDRE